MEFKMLLAVFLFALCGIIEIAQAQANFRGEIGPFQQFRPTRRFLRLQNRRRATRRCTRRQRRRDDPFFNKFPLAFDDDGLCDNLFATPPVPGTTRPPRTIPPRTTPPPPPTQGSTTAAAQVTSVNNFSALPSANVAELTRRANNFIQNDEEMIPNLIQMVFHVCVGGCDGCLNLDTPDNKGLRASYPTVKVFCQNQMQPLTLADCIVFMASKAVEAGMHKNDELRGITVPFTTGRVTCPDPDNYHMDFKFPAGDDPHSLEFLQTEFKINQKEAIALMGAHSVGRCRKENSGFDGPWDFTELSMDNGYYKSMLGTEWVKRDISGSTQWTTSKNNNRMMLHADISLVRDVSVGSNHQPSCSNAKDCPKRSTANQVLTYSKNEREWANDFVDVFVKMVNRKR